jgi:hypothetical protein
MVELPAYGALDDGAPDGAGRPLPRAVGRRRAVGTALAGVTAACALATLVFLAVSAKHGGGARRTELWGWTKDSLESGDAKISAEEVEQLSSILDAQDNLKKNLQRMAEKLDKGRGTEIAVEQGNNSPQGPDGERGFPGPKGPPGPAGVMGPPGPVGKDGAQGPKGAEGVQGPPGKRGPPGEQGGIGAGGQEGPKGNMGAVGYPGEPGNSGPQGPPGPEQPNMAGPAGPLGPVGPAGPSGPSGESGPRGPPGQPNAPLPPPVIIQREPPAPPTPPVSVSPPQPEVPVVSTGDLQPPAVPPALPPQVPPPQPEVPVVATGDPQPPAVPPALPPPPQPEVPVVPTGDPHPPPVPPALPPPVPLVPPAPVAVEAAPMPAGMTGLNVECAKWRDNRAGTGAKPSLVWQLQMKQMAYCMQQDCIQSMNPQTCRYTDPNRLCYTLPGQGWCAEAANAGHPGCKDLGAEVTAANLNGPGTWAPLVEVPVWGPALASAPAPTYACNCFKKCSHYTGSNTLKKYFCSGGVAIKVGLIEGTPAATAIASSSSKDSECACSCGYPNDLASWQAGDAQ